MDGDSFLLQKKSDVLLQGKVIKTTRGLFWVEASGALYACKTRGTMRRDQVTVLVGDLVRFNVQPENTGMIETVLPRKNSLIRPPVANIDCLVIVISVCDPSPNFLVTDKMIAIAEKKGIEPVLAVTKSDMESDLLVRDVYGKIRMPMFTVSNETGEGIDKIREYLQGKTAAFTGNTGVGKSSLLNQLDSRLALETGDTSKKLGRGRHTTRTVELFPVGPNTLIADTPGFSTVDIERFEVIRKEELQDCFREFEPYLGKCRFTGCSHTKEKGCAVLEAVNRDEISKIRHQDYILLYQAAQNIHDWEQKKEREN